MELIQEQTLQSAGTLLCNMSDDVSAFYERVLLLMLLD